MLQYELSYIKQRYHVLFGQAREEIETAFQKLHDEFACPQCAAYHQKDSPLPDSPLDPLHAGCGYRYWQEACLEWLEQNYGRSLVASIETINTARDAVSCHQCGVCCRFASSEFSYQELLDKASAGDEFARQFTSVFLPYADTDAARAKFPELVDDILLEVRKQAANEDNSHTKTDTAPVHFYHCPYIGEDNRCTIYGTPKRPAICQSYPDTPLTFIYNKCAWKPWKNEYHDEAMKAHGGIELALFFAGKIRAALAANGSNGPS